MTPQEESVQSIEQDREIIKELIEKYEDSLDQIDDGEDYFIFETILQNIVINLRQVNLNLSGISNVYKMLINEEKGRKDGSNTTH